MMTAPTYIAELECIRARFQASQNDPHAFACWIGQDCLDDFRYLLGLLDGLIEEESNGFADLIEKLVDVSV